MLRRILIILGALVALLPYLGLPRSWDNVLFTFAGLAIVVLLVLSKRSSSSREVSREAPEPVRESIETKHVPRPAIGIKVSSATTSREGSSRPLHAAQKTIEAFPKTEVRRVTRVSPSRPAPSSSLHRTPMANSPTSNDVVIPPPVRSSPPPPVSRTSEASKIPTDQPFPERKTVPTRRQKPRTAEDFLKGDSA